MPLSPWRTGIQTFEDHVLKTMFYVRLAKHPLRSLDGYKKLDLLDSRAALQTAQRVAVLVI